MADRANLITITGWAASLLRLVVGVPLLVVGGLLVSAGLGSVTELGNIVVLGLGAVLGIAGAYNCLMALQGRDISVTLGSGKWSQE